MPPRAIKAQTIRAILFAKATRTSIGGLRNSRLPMCNRPKRKRDFEADLGALSGADMCPAS